MWSTFEVGLHFKRPALVELSNKGRALLYPSLCYVIYAFEIISYMQFNWLVKAVVFFALSTQHVKYP